MGKSTISMAMFNCFFYVHQAGYPLLAMTSMTASGLSAGHEPVVERPATDRENEDVASNSTVGKGRTIVSIKC